MPEDILEETSRLSEFIERMISPAVYIRLLDALPVALLLVDRNRVLILVNRQAEFLFGYHRSELLGKDLEILVPERFRERHRFHMDRFMREPQERSMGINMDLAGRTKEGEEFGVEIHLSPLQTPEGLFVSAVVRPIKAPEQVDG